MQASAQPQPPIAPSRPDANPATVALPGPEGTMQTITVPRTRAELQELRLHRQELSDQVSNVSARRRRLSEEIRSAPDGASRAGLEERIRLLDQRILQLESDLALTGRQISSAPARVLASSAIPGAGNVNDEMVVGGLVTMLIAFVIVLKIARRRWKRTGPSAAPHITLESAQRLERLERGMEAIAIEIERVSEGQRFVTKLLSAANTPPVSRQQIPERIGVQRDDDSDR